MSFAPPVQLSSRLTSPFGERPSRRTGAPTFHAGVDFRASTGDPVYAVAPSTVRVVRTDAQGGRGTPTYGYGNVVGLEHADGTWSIYAHLSRIQVAEGDMVVAGQQIGLAGSTSNRKFPGMGAHLHFEIRVPTGAGRVFPGAYRRYNVDPQAWLLERGIGIDGAITVDAARAAGAPGLGQATPVPSGPEELGLPDEPIRDLDTFDPPSAGLVAGLAGTGLLTVAGALMIARG